MKSSIIYYPSITLPNENWVWNSLAFYKKIMIIRPKSYDTQHGDVGILDDLAKHDLVDWLDPGDLLHDLDHDGFAQEIISRKRVLDKFLEGKTVRHDNCNIHVGKIHYGVFMRLQDEGLLTLGRETKWYSVPKPVAYIYMTMLAEKFSQDKQADIMTEERSEIAAINELIISNFSGPEKVDHQPLLRKRIFNAITTYTPNLIPIPDLRGIDEVIKMRERYSDNLEDFLRRVSIDQKQIVRDCLNDLREETHLHERGALENLVKEKMKSLSTKYLEESDDLSRNMENALKFSIIRSGIACVPILISCLSNGTSLSISILNGLAAFAREAVSLHQANVQLRNNPLYFATVFRRNRR